MKKVCRSRGLSSRPTTTNLQQTYETWWNDMARYSIKGLKKVLRNYRNSTIWNTMTWYAKCPMLVPTMKP